MLLLFLSAQAIGQDQARENPNDPDAKAVLYHACAEEIKVAEASSPQTAWFRGAWENQFKRFRQPGEFFERIREHGQANSPWKDRDIPFHYLYACASIAYVELKKNGAGSGPAALARWRNSRALFESKLPADRARIAAEQGKTNPQSGSPAAPASSSGAGASGTNAAPSAGGRWPAGVEPGNLYLARFGSVKRWRDTTFLVSAKTKSEAVALVERAISNLNEFYRQDRDSPYRIVLREVTEKNCEGPNWGASVWMGDDSRHATASVCGAKTPREAILHASKLCAEQLGGPCRLDPKKEGRMVVSIGHSGARPWGGLADGFGRPAIGGWPGEGVSFAALGASTRQSSWTNQYILSPEDAINQFGKACGATAYGGKDTHSCWITSKNLGCVYNNNGQNTRDDTYQKNCVDTKLTAEGYLP